MNWHTHMPGGERPDDEEFPANPPLSEEDDVEAVTRVPAVRP